ncbi:hypothetical protein FGO68_gene11715 [Halteria grandinella]|uniref:Uncharacterized protein n=1 Tax=Halteria grandinella TaxID=5974 RepID=A0A8J8SUY8_HALGN|nr:hypothetical protein FGO68_gene11715 [Halteria grandinella]
MQRPSQESKQSNQIRRSSKKQQKNISNIFSYPQVIACSKPDAIEDFSKDTGFPKENLYVSTDLQAYKSFGMKRAQNISEIKGQGTNADSTTGMISGMAWYLWKQISRGSQGDIYQLGGEVLFDEDGVTIHLCKTNQSSQDYMSASQIKQLMRI